MTPEDKKMSDAVWEAIIAFGKTAVSGRVPFGPQVVGNHDHIFEAYNNLKDAYKEWSFGKFFPEE